MKPKLIEITKENLSLMGQAIKNGKLVCFKTDTIYGIATNPFNEVSVDNIFKAKQRPDNKPIILLASPDFELESLVYISQTEKLIMEKYWPGELTIIFNLKPNHNLASGVTCGQNTLAIRQPKDILCQTLISSAGGLITSTSANISGQETKSSAVEIVEDFKDTILDYVLNTPPATQTLSSTLIKVENEKVIVLRQGKIKVEL